MEARAVKVSSGSPLGSEVTSGHICGQLWLVLVRECPPHYRQTTHHIAAPRARCSLARPETEMMPGISSRKRCRGRRRPTGPAARFGGSETPCRRCSDRCSGPLHRWNCTTQYVLELWLTVVHGLGWLPSVGFRSWSRCLAVSLQVR